MSAGGRVISIDPPATKVILCIDDDLSILRYETALLERSGYSVLTAASGQEGLGLVASRHCDAVLLDYEMHGLNGQEIASQIRLIKPELKVIMLSGSEVPTQALALVDAFVHKLESSRQLLPTIARLCARTADAQPRHESRHEDRQ